MKDPNNYITKETIFVGGQCGFDFTPQSANRFTARKYQEDLTREISQRQLSECLERLESLGIPPDFGISLLPFLQDEIVGGDANG